MKNNTTPHSNEKTTKKTQEFFFDQCKNQLFILKKENKYAKSDYGQKIIFQGLKKCDFILLRLKTTF